MLFFINLISADYFKLTNSDKFIGAQGGRIVLTDAKNAVSFKRVRNGDSLSGSTAFTYDNNSKMISMNSSKDVVEQASSSSTANNFQVLLNPDSAYFIRNPSGCIDNTQTGLKITNCTSSNAGSFFLITDEEFNNSPKKAVVEKFGVHVGEWLQDPLSANQIKNGLISDLVRKTMLLPFADRLKGAAPMSPAPVTKERFLVLFNNY